jgi:hypothetical protein
MCARAQSTDEATLKAIDFEGGVTKIKEANAAGMCRREERVIVLSLPPFPAAVPPHIFALQPSWFSSQTHGLLMALMLLLEGPGAGAVDPVVAKLVMAKRQGGMEGFMVGAGVATAWTTVSPA